jgi:hypothetical protein
MDLLTGVEPDDRSARVPEGDRVIIAENGLRRHIALNLFGSGEYARGVAASRVRVRVLHK